MKHIFISTALLFSTSCFAVNAPIIVIKEKPQELTLDMLLNNLCMKTTEKVAELGKLFENHNKLVAKADHTEKEIGESLDNIIEKYEEILPTLLFVENNAIATKQLLEKYVEVAESAEIVDPVSSSPDFIKILKNRRTQLKEEIDLLLASNKKYPVLELQK